MNRRDRRRIRHNLCLFVIVDVDRYGERETRQGKSKNAIREKVVCVSQRVQGGGCQVYSVNSCMCMDVLMLPRLSLCR